MDLPTLIDVEEARRLVLADAKPLPPESVNLDDAQGRILADTVSCDVDFPPFSRATMDGFAVKAADTTDAPVALRLTGQIPAGFQVQAPLAAGEAMQINTGAPIPRGADTVVRVELTTAADDGQTINVQESVPAGKFVTPRAAFVASGGVVLEPGTALGPLELAVAATAGASTVTAYRRPRLAVLSTGDELIGVNQSPTGAQIRNSNAHLLVAASRSAGGIGEHLGIVGDDRALLGEYIRRGLDADGLCITGGISMGAYDFVPEVLQSCGVVFRFRKMRIKPGRPVIFGVASSGTLVFALPGNPVSAYVGFELLVRAAMQRMQGQAPGPLRYERSRLDGRLSSTRDRRAFRPGRWYVDEHGDRVIRPLAWQGSGDPFGMATANALIMQPPDSDAPNSGDPVMMLPINRHY
ncbi:MAG: molybdopterin molybdotransferase MoeA [Planctomycetota bacterium]|jgi:molybdopterin molybdotransferase